jgi:hypothetical protein
MTEIELVATAPLFFSGVTTLAIYTLQGKVSVLEDVVKELQSEIKRLG